MEFLYRQKLELSGEHIGAINCLAISPDASYIASGGSDNLIVIWSLSPESDLYGHPLRRLVTQSSVLSLLWPKGLDKLICGTADGTLLTITLDEVSSDLFQDGTTRRAILLIQGLMSGRCRSPPTSLDLRHIQDLSNFCQNVWTCTWGAAVWLLPVSTSSNYGLGMMMVIFIELPKRMLRIDSHILIHDLYR